MLEINLLPVREARRKACLRQYVMQFVLVVIVMVGGVGVFHSRLNDRIDRTQARVRALLLLPQAEILWSPSIPASSGYDEERLAPFNKAIIVYATVVPR